MIVWKDEHVTLFRSALYETISSVVVTDDCVLVVDPCWLPNEVEEIKQYVIKVRNSRPLYLLFTHSDYDHILGYQAFPDAIVIASEPFATKPLKDKEAIIEEIKAFDDEYYLTRNYDIVYPEVDHAIEGDETRFSIGQTNLTFFQAPGHNDDGILTVIEPLGILIAGDYFSDIEFPYIYFSSTEYEKALLKLNDILEQYPIQLLVPGHGTPTRDHAEMLKRQQDSLEYIRKMRMYIKEENQKEIDQLIDGCKFPRNMKKFHDQNKNVFIQELSE